MAQPVPTKTVLAEQSPEERQVPGPVYPGVESLPPILLRAVVIIARGLQTVHRILGFATHILLSQADKSIIDRTVQSSTVGNPNCDRGAGENEYDRWTTGIAPCRCQYERYVLRRRTCNRICPTDRKRQRSGTGSKNLALEPKNQRVHAVLRWCAYANQWRGCHLVDQAEHHWSLEADHSILETLIPLLRVLAEHVIRVLF